MLNWFSKYRSPFAAKPAPSTPALPAAKPGQAAAKAAAAAAADKAQRKADTRAQQAEQDQAAWAPRWQAALGDDAALLKIALDCPVLMLRQSAVEALVSEDALRQAETAFRNKDRRVHQVAKRRYEAAVLRRESLAKGQALLASAQALAGQGLVPVNHLVVLDRDWAALDPALLGAPLIEAFTLLRQSLGGLAQAQAELQQRTQRRSQDARQRQAALQAAGQALLTPDAADAPDFTALAAASDAVQTLLDDSAQPALDAALAGSLQALLQDARALQARLHWLVMAVPAASAPVLAESVSVAPEEAPAAAHCESAPVEEAASPEAVSPGAALVDATLAEAVLADAAAADSAPAEPAPAEPAPAEAAVAEHPDAAPAPASTSEASPLPTAPPTAWSDLPAISQAAWAATLDQRFAAIQRQQEQQLRQQQLQPDRAPADRLPRRAAGPAPVWSAQQLAALAQRLQQADAALADGHLGPLQRHLQAFDQGLTRGPALPPGDSLLQRAAALQAEHQRLKSWQQWGGGRARDDLAAEAEVLARATAAAADPALADAPKLDLKAHAEAINALRGRWRELDRLGAAASQALWQRFDAALKDAYQPVAERQAVQKAQRQQNQREREALLAALEAWPGTPPEAPPEAPAAAEPADQAIDPAIDPSADPSGDTSADPGAWKERIRALDRFHNAWRQLGPLEHTVPAVAREPLRQRQQQALERLEAPLQQARRDAAGRREALIQQAEALAERAAQAPRPAADSEPGRRNGAADFSRRPGTEDVAQQVRNLQADWQQQARELPLARGVEAALWGRFRAALDAVFAQRQAVYQARDAEAAAHSAEREAWIARLAALPADAPAADARRLLAEADQAWRQPLDLPRGLAAALDGRYRDARGAVQQRLADAVGRQWQAWCDALLAGLQQALQREQSGAAAPAAALGEAPADLPTTWARALADRLAAPVAPGPMALPAFDALLLPLEAALDMPATAEQQAARRLLKLQALKQTLEGRASPAAAPASPADALVAALRQAALPQAQQQRVLALVAALRRAAPGVAGLPQPRV